jgi:hypothetical protein
MMKFLVVVAFTATVLTGAAFAQEDGGGGGGGGLSRGAGGSGLPSGIDGPRTIPQQFASKLKLDKTQSPAVDQILIKAAAEAAPFAQQMLQARQRILNASRAGLPDEVKAAQSGYASAAAKIAGIEQSAFAKVYALLKPNQQKEAPQAFALIAGLFSSSPAATGGAPRGPAGGR